MDDIIEDLNPIGKYQILNVIFIGIPSALGSMTTYSTIFIAAKPDFICNEYNNIKYNNSENINNCKLWSQWNNKSENMKNCYFDSDYYGNTIINDWNLVCDRKFLAGLTQTFYMLGALLSAFTGYFGDRFGRKKSTIGFLWCHSIIMLISQILLTNEVINLNIDFKYAIYCITQLMVGGLVMSLYASGYVLLLETTTHKYHTLFSSLKLVFYIFGEFVIMAVAYFTKNWFIINWVVTGISIVCSIITVFLLDESVRWLVVQERFDEAMKILEKIARYNKRELKIKQLNSTIRIDKEVVLKGNKIEPLNNKLSTDNNENDKLKVDKSIKSMFKGTFYPRKIFIKTSLIAYVWVAVTLLYFGQSFSITSIDSINPYILYTFQSIAELIGYWLAMFNDKFGRRKPSIFYLFITASMCLIVSLTPRNTDTSNNKKVILDSILVIGLISIAKCAISSVFNTIYVYTSELYSTNVRNFALLFCSCFGRLGSLISPQIILLGDIVWKPLPYLLFSIAGFFASIALFILPETK